MRRGLVRLSGGVLTLLLVLVAARIAAPYAIQWYVNKQLDQAENFTGQIGDVDLNLIRGAYVIENVRIEKTEGEIPVPFFSAERVDFSVYWSALLEGSLVGEVWLTRPELNIVDSETEEDKQTGEDEPWQDIVQGLFPLKIDSFVVEQGNIHFRNFSSDPPVDIYLSEVYARLTNFTNSLDVSDTLVATLEGTAVPMEQGDLDVRLRFDPYTEQPQFDLNLRLTDLNVSSLNDFIEAYTNLDVEAGTMDLAMEMATDQGHVTGYLKPVIHNLEVFDWQKDVVEEDEGFLATVWEGFAGLVSELFENQPQDTFATRVPIDGQIDDPEAGIFNALRAILRNAFIEAIQPDVEGSVELEDAEPGESESENDSAGSK